MNDRIQLKKIISIFLFAGIAGAAGFFFLQLASPVTSPIAMAPSQVEPSHTPSPVLKREPILNSPSSTSVSSARSQENLASIPSQPKSTNNHVSSPALTTTPRTTKSIFLWTGLGATYVNFNQSDSQNLATASFSKIMAPTFSVGGEAELSETFKLHLTYHQSLGKIPARENVSAQDKDYKQVRIRTEAEWVLEHSLPMTFSALLGLQTQDLSFMFVDENGALTVLDSNLLQVSLGGKLIHQASEGLSYVWSLHYNHLLSSSGGRYAFQASSAQIFDTELGINKKLPSGMVAGLYWTAEYIKFNYDWSGNGMDTSGSQSFFTPSVELRVGYEF